MGLLGVQLQSDQATIVSEGDPPQQFASTSPRCTVEPIFTESPLYMVTGNDSPVKGALIYVNLSIVHLSMPLGHISTQHPLFSLLRGAQTHVHNPMSTSPQWDL